MKINDSLAILLLKLESKRLCKFNCKECCLKCSYLRDCFRRWKKGNYFCKARKHGGKSWCSIPAEYLAKILGIPEVRPLIFKPVRKLGGKKDTKLLRE